MWPGKISGSSGLSYIRVQSFAVRSTPDLSAALLPHGCFPSLTKSDERVLQINTGNILSIHSLQESLEFLNQMSEYFIMSPKYTILASMPPSSH